MNVLELHPLLIFHLDSKLKVFLLNLLVNLKIFNTVYYMNILNNLFVINHFYICNLFLPEISCHSGESNEYFPSIIFLNITICLRCQNGGQPINL